MVIDTGNEADRKLDELVPVAHRVTDAVETVISGKPEAIRLAMTVLLAEGHILIEDVPGVGKTLLAKALARSIDCSVRRVQFTPDLLPGVCSSSFSCACGSADARRRIRNRRGSGWSITREWRAATSHSSGNGMRTRTRIDACRSHACTI